MREIKFRGKDLKSGEWVYGNLSHYVTEKDAMIECVTHDGKTVLITTHFVGLDSIGQFTGLYDSRNTPIYEGDIIESNRIIRHLIGYSIEEARFCCTPTQYVGDDDFERCERCGLDQKWINEFGKVVIGNKWDNPELLNK